MLSEKQVYRLVLKDYPDILDLKQVCTILEISRKTAYKLIKDGIISHMKVGREYRVPKVALLSFFFQEDPDTDTDNN